MKNKIIALIVICCSLGFLSQCQRDDICPETTQSTPLLVIRFLDFDNPENYSSVPDFTIKATSEEENFITETTLDSIAIPLKTFENFTEFEFRINDGADEDPDNVAIPNTDVVNISYAPEQVYLNRACGYIVNYTLNNVTVEAEEPSNRWIRQITIEQLNVENETNAHIFIYH